MSRINRRTVDIPNCFRIIDKVLEATQREPTFGARLALRQIAEEMRVCWQCRPKAVAALDALEKK